MTDDSRETKQPTSSAESETAQKMSRTAIAALLVSNLIVCIPVLTGAWSVHDLIVLYWAENVLVVFITYLRIRLLPRDWDTYLPGESRMKSNGKVVPPKHVPSFFAFFWGFACTVHGLLVFIFFGRGVTFSWTSFGLVYGVLAISHGLSFVMNYFIKNERSRLTMEGLLNEPHRRVLLLHGFVLVGGIVFMAVPFLKMPAVLVVFVVLKIALDLHAHIKTHKPPLTENT